MQSSESNRIAKALFVSDEKLIGAEVRELMRLIEQGAGRPSEDSANRHLRGLPAISLDLGQSPKAGGLRTYLPEHIGNGYWDFIQVAPGIHCGITDASYRSNHQLELPAERLTKIRIICEGRLRIADEIDLIGPRCAHIHSLLPDSRLAYVIQPGELRMVTLHLTETGLESLGLDSQALHRATSQNYQPSTGGTATKRIEPASHLIQVANEILHSRDRVPPAFRLTYVTGKSWELLTEALTAFLYGAGSGDNRLDVRSTRLKRRLHEAQEILDATLAEPPTIDQLARLVGINRTTLKAEFKALVGCTIHQYQSMKRMAEAKRLIEETELPITAIAEKLGFTQASQFSTLVRRSFGASPRELRRILRDA